LRIVSSEGFLAFLDGVGSSRHCAYQQMVSVSYCPSLEFKFIGSSVQANAEGSLLLSCSITVGLHILKSTMLFSLK